MRSYLLRYLTSFSPNTRRIASQIPRCSTTDIDKYFMNVSICIVTSFPPLIGWRHIGLAPRIMRVEDGGTAKKNLIQCYSVHKNMDFIDFMDFLDFLDNPGKLFGRIPRPVRLSWDRIYCHLSQHLSRFTGRVPSQIPLYSTTDIIFSSVCQYA